MTNDNDKVICPNCAHEFTAVPVNLQTEIKMLELKYDARHRSQASTAEPLAPTSADELAELVVPDTTPDTSEPVLVGRGVLRVAARVTGGSEDVRNRLTDGRLAVARLIGGGSHARSAHLGLIEIAAALCRPTAPLCDPCPLRQRCAYACAATLAATKAAAVATDAPTR